MSGPVSYPGLREDTSGAWLSRNMLHTEQQLTGLRALRQVGDCLEHGTTIPWSSAAAALLC